MKLEWLLYLALPFIAAVIGYFTNWVAIWMLFRPYTEKRILGIRLPFTPGVIPGRRLEMAERMGTAISQHLINESSIQERLDAPELRAQIERALTRQSEELLSKDWGSINALIPKQWEPEWQSLKSSILESLKTELVHMLHSKRMEELITSEVHRQLDEWSSQPIESYISSDLLDALPQRGVELYDNMVASEEFEDGLKRFLQATTRNLSSLDHPLAEYVPQSIKASLYSKLPGFLPILREKLLQLLQDETLKKRARIAIYDLVDNVLSETFKENSKWDQFKFSLMETFFISVEEIKEKIDNGIDEAVPHISEMLSSPEVEARILSTIESGIDSLLQKRLSEFDVGSGEKNGLSGTAAEIVLRSLRSEGARETCAELIAENIDKRKSDSLQELLGDYVDVDEISALLASHILKFVREESTLTRLMELILKELDCWLDKPIGVLRSRVPEDIVQRAIGWMTDRSVDLLKQETPRILNAIDVEALVRDQVNKLPIDEVERLTLAITSRQLRAITWFGALLGFTIGLIQLLVVILTGGFI